MNFNNPMQQLLNMGRPQIQPQQQRIPIDQNKLTEFMKQIDQNTLSSFVSQARMQGIPDSEIEKGLNALLSLR